MAINRKKFSSQVKPDILEAFKSYAETEGRQFQVLLEEAMQEYLETRTGERARESVLAHFKASVEKNRELGELLAK